MTKFVGKVAIVTGGAAGIGGATSRLLAAGGADVLIADVNMTEAQVNADLIRSAGGTAEVLYTDVGKHEHIAAMVQASIDHWGRLDIVVNNAFSPTDESDGDALTVTETAWDAGMATLVKAHFLAAKYAVPHMRAVGGGSIVNISSVHGLLMAPQKLIYEAGKSAVIGITKQMAIDFGPDGIRVNAICPGHIVTERQRERWDENPSGLRYFEDQYPVRRTGTPDDIANAVAFLSSDEASFITGHALIVDGGLTVQLQEDFSVRQVHYIREHPETQMPY
ncbi:MAG: glucose 1-dehydrogenase [Chloroflexi bacterium]|nr:glucose 1-dehydrogenase [Chloroflexota bacterium]